MSEPIVSKHKVVYVTYSILNEQGVVFEQYDIPIGYVHGANSGLFEKIEEGLEGHAAGERVEVTLPPADGFGDHKPELTFTDDIDNVPPEHRRIGSEVSFENDKARLQRKIDCETRPVAEGGLGRSHADILGEFAMRQVQNLGARDLLLEANAIWLQDANKVVPCRPR